MSDKNWLDEILMLNDENTMSEKQKKIVAAAIEIFSEKGYASTSTNEIAKKAGVAEGTIFRHYKTKKDLLLSIVAPTLAKVVAPFLAKGFIKEVFEKDHQNYEQFIRTLLLNRYHFVKNHIPMVRIFLQEIAFQPELQSECKKIFTDNVYQSFQKITLHFQNKGEIVKFPPDTVIRMTMTTIIGFLMTRFLILPDQQWDDTIEMEDTIQFLMHGLANDHIEKEHSHIT
ncbi:TetR family transcriptional regulator [Desulfuribacillus stibiiarsenatis]|uniref:TetR family transcriptional regulator n=1 Tax=Desulfuribacillus stibiiarsenatis TaxID=1390249 RepID=A0A1E5L578_9FIRM|nr:TetR/AcrR family transcriptional regulator [Desulfuribacillus stibiiarsenatis]OEH85271.1 TetR family transcriptional regulator [Desulfuribacillus stibiiarsenatis]